jgi:hypothetical protein
MDQKTKDERRVREQLDSVLRQRSHTAAARAAASLKVYEALSLSY